MAARRARHPADQKSLARVLDAPVGGSVRLRAASERRVSVVVDGRSIGTLDADAAQSLGLRSGGKWSPELALRVARAVEKDQAARAAERLLAVRERSRGELLTRLKRRGVKPAIADALVGEFVRTGKVDDERFAGLLARSILRVKPAGERLIRARLRASQVDAALAAREAKHALAGRDPLEDALALARARLKRLPAGLDGRAKARRLLGALGRRGFDVETASRAVRLLIRLDENRGS